MRRPVNGGALLACCLLVGVGVFQGGCRSETAWSDTAGASFGEIDYPIVYVRVPRRSDGARPRFGQALTWQPGADLVLRHPAGSEEVLVEGGASAIVDPAVSLDAETIYYAELRFPGIDGPAASRQGVAQSADIFSLALETGEVVQLTFGDATASPSNEEQTSAGVLNVSPCPISGQRIVFASNRNIEISPLTQSTGALRLFVMEADGSGVRALRQAPAVDAFRPVLLTDGRVLFASRSGRATDLWIVLPDASGAEPLSGPLDRERTLSPGTQLADGSLLAVAAFGGDPRLGTLWRLAEPAGDGSGAAGEDEWLPDLGYIAHPSIAPGYRVLLAASPDAAFGIGAPPDPATIDRGLYLFDSETPAPGVYDLSLVVNDPVFHELQPRAVVPYGDLYSLTAPIDVAGPRVAPPTTLTDEPVVPPIELDDDPVEKPVPAGGGGGASEDTGETVAARESDRPSELVGGRVDSRDLRFVGAFRLGDGTRFRASSIGNGGRGLTYNPITHSIITSGKSGGGGNTHFMTEFPIPSDVQLRSAGQTPPPGVLFTASEATATAQRLPESTPSREWIDPTFGRREGTFQWGVKKGAWSKSASEMFLQDIHIRRSGPDTGKVYMTLRKYYAVSLDQQHPWLLVGDIDANRWIHNVRGPYWVRRTDRAPGAEFSSDIHKMAGYLFDIPPTWAQRHLEDPTRLLGCGFTVGQGISLTSNGPAIFAMDIPPQSDMDDYVSTLFAEPVLFYPHAKRLKRFQPSDPRYSSTDGMDFDRKDWTRGCTWVTTRNGRSSAIMWGRHGDHTFPAPYGAPPGHGTPQLPKNFPFEHVASPDKGTHDEPYRPNVLFYDDEELATASTYWEAKPFEVWTPPWYWWNKRCYTFGAAYDREAQRIYVSQGEVFHSDGRYWPLIYVLEVVE